MDESLPKVKLDGAEVPEEKLREQMQRKDVRIIEVSPGEFKTLQKLQE